MKPYEIRSSEDTVEVWSQKRLPFEPKGDLRALRDEIRRALANLSPGGTGALHGLHVAKAFGGSDAENVLFYNVGAAAFRPIARRELVFERRQAAPAPAPSGSSYANYVSVLWNPADDRCLYGRLRFEQAPAWTISGTLSAID